MNTDPSLWDLQEIRNTYNPHPELAHHIEQCHSTIDDQIDPGQLDFLVVPGKYLRASNLTYAEKFLMSYIAMADQEKHCWAKDKAFARWLGCNEKTIRNMMSSLKKKGYIEQISYNGKKRIIKCSK